MTHYVAQPRAAVFACFLVGLVCAANSLSPAPARLICAKCTLLRRNSKTEVRDILAAPQFRHEDEQPRAEKNSDAHAPRKAALNHTAIYFRSVLRRRRARRSSAIASLPAHPPGS